MNGSTEQNQIHFLSLLQFKRFEPSMSVRSLYFHLLHPFIYITYLENY